MAITKEVLAELLKNYKGPEDLTGENGLLKQLTKALVETAMGAELNEHLGFEKNQSGEKSNENRRNGSSVKTVRSDHGPIELAVPRDRDASFEPKIVEKHQREFAVFSVSGNSNHLVFRPGYDIFHGSISRGESDGEEKTRLGGDYSRAGRKRGLDKRLL